MEGGAEGAFSYNNRLNGVSESLAGNLSRIDEIGGPLSMPAVPAGWARATDAPFSMEQNYYAHRGGVHQQWLLAISWPGHVSAIQKVRFQFHHRRHRADYLPAVGISPPAQVDGVESNSRSRESACFTVCAILKSFPSRTIFRSIRQHRLFSRTAGYCPAVRIQRGSLYDKTNSKVVWELSTTFHTISPKSTTLRHKNHHG